MGVEKDRLLDMLFGDDKVQHRNIKFMRGDEPDLTEEQFCKEVNSALLQKRTGLVEALAVFPRSSKHLDLKDAKL